MYASVLELADNRDLKSCALWACGFEPRHSHLFKAYPCRPDFGVVFLRHYNRFTNETWPFISAKPFLR